MSDKTKDYFRVQTAKPADPTTEPTQDRQFFPCGRNEPSSATTTAEPKGGKAQ